MSLPVTLVFVVAACQSSREHTSTRRGSDTDSSLKRNATHASYARERDTTRSRSLESRSGGRQEPHIHSYWIPQQRFPCSDARPRPRSATGSNGRRLCEWHSAECRNVFDISGGAPLYLGARINET